MADEPQNLEQLLEDLCQAGKEEEEVTLDEVLDEIGHRSFGPLLLLAGFIMAAPIIGDIPGMPTAMGSLVFLTTIQIIFHHEHIWLPQWLLERSVGHDKLYKGIEWMEKPARFIDQWLQPRWHLLVNGAGTYVIAAICLIIAVTTPFMEIVPFVANGAGLAILAFGLSLVARDGLLAVIAFVIVVTTAGLSLYYFL